MRCVNASENRRSGAASIFAMPPHRQEAVRALAEQADVAQVRPENSSNSNRLAELAQRMEETFPSLAHYACDIREA